MTVFPRCALTYSDRFYIKIINRAFRGKIRRGVSLNSLNLPKGVSNNMVMDRISMILVIIGALNWGSIGLFRFDIVAWICGGQDAVVARVIYTVVALAGLWCISLLFRRREARYES